MAYDPNAYANECAAHRRALRMLGNALVLELTALDNNGNAAADGPRSWHGRTVEDHESCYYLDRDDGLKLTLYWYQGRGNRPHVSPVVPHLPGSHFNTPKVKLEAAFDPSRPPKAIARDVYRRVVRPWEAQLPGVVAQNDATTTRWHTTEQRAAAIARALGVSLREDAIRLIQDGNDVPFGIGNTYSVGLDVDVKVSNYKGRAKFNIEIEDDDDLAVELATLMRRRFQERIERNGQALCTNCHAQPRDTGRDLCSACGTEQRRFGRLRGEADA